MSVSVIRYSAVCLMAGSFLSSSAYADYNCTKSPDCASLGYTMSADDCAEGAVKVACPTDLSKFFCKGKSVPCVVGSLLGGDQLCYSPDASMPDGVEPVGVVFDATNRLAVALTDVKKDSTAGSEAMLWSEKFCDISGLENCSNGNTVTTCGIDGDANTDAIIDSAGDCSGMVYAANAVKNYISDGCQSTFCTPIFWFLPSMKELWNLYREKAAVNKSLEAVGGNGAKTLTENRYWSSNEKDSVSVWTLNMKTGAIASQNRWTSALPYVRPVVKY